MANKISEINNKIALSINPPSLSTLTKRLSRILLAKHLMLTTAESCTGGWVAQVLTSIVGSSAWFERGFVVYSNAAKEEMLGVDQSLIQTYGAVSREVAVAMAQGALQFSHAQLSLSITGIAGPGGGSEQKPVGTVCFAWAGELVGVHVEQKHFSGSRSSVRRQAVHHVLQYLLSLVDFPSS